MHQQQTAFENIMGKEETACKKQFILFPQCFLHNQIIVPHLSIILTSNFNLLLKWKNPKLAYEVTGQIPVCTFNDQVISADFNSFLICSLINFEKHVCES